MADYTIRVVAETSEADDKVKRLDKRLQEVSHDRKIHIEIPSISETIASVKSLGETLKTTYSIARSIPVVGPRIRDIEDLGNIASETGNKVATAFKLIASATPGRILATSFSASNTAIEELAKRTSNLGYTIFGVTQSVKLLQSTFGSMFDDTVGREIKLRESILRTKTTLASTAQVVKNGKILANPLDAITALDKPIDKTIASIRLRSLEIAGTTSEAIIQVFGTVAAQIGKVGGSIKDAEDLAISFSAALGTMGLSDPYYAVQEIRSIMTGTIDNNSILATSLGITNEEIAKAKSSSEGIVAYLQKRLAAFTVGQSIAAKAYAGLVSNVKEFSDEFKRAFGKELLDPLLEGLQVLYDRLQSVFKASYGIANGVGKAFGAIARGVVGAAAAAPSLAGLNQGSLQKGADRAELASAGGVVAIQDAIDRLRPQIATLSDQVIRALAQIGVALGTLAKGFAIFKFEQFKVLLAAVVDFATVINTVAVPAVASLLSMYGKLLEQPIVQYTAQLGAQFEILNKVGVLPLAKTLFVLNSIVPSVISTFRKLGEITTWIKAQIANLVDLVVTGFSAAIANVSTLIANVGRTIVSGVVVGITTLIIALKQATVQLGIFLIQLAELILQAAPQFGAVAVAISDIGKSLLGVEVALEKAQVSFVEFSLRAANALDALQLKTDQVKDRIAGVGETIKENIGGAAQSVTNNFKEMIKGFLIFTAQLIALQVVITLVYDAFTRFQRRQQEISDQTRAELAVKRLSTAYADLGQNATAAEKALKAYEEQKLDSQIEALKKRLGELDDAIARATSLQRIKNFGDVLRNAAAMFNFNNFDIKQKPGDTFRSALLKVRQKQFEETKQELEKLDAAQKRLQKREESRNEIELRAKERKALENEIRDLRRQHENEIFQQRQSLAQKEVEIFQTAGELRIFQMEQANQKLIEGEEGASRAALESLNNYLSVRERGELEIESAKQNLAVEVANMERSILNYRLDMEKKIFDLRKRAGENDIASAKAREQMAGASFGPLSEIIGSRESYGGDYTAFNRGGYAQGHRAIGSGKDPNLTNMTIAEIQRRQLAPGVAKNQQLHAVGKYQIIGKTLQNLLQGKYGDTGVKSSDKFTPEVQEVLGSALARARIVPGSVNKTMAGLRAEWVGLQNVPTKDLLPAVKELMAGGSAAAPRVSTAATPQLQGRSDIGDGKREAEEYAAAVRAVSTAMERLRILQKALTDAKSKEALEAIAKAAFTPVALEQYQDQLAEVQLTYEALAASSSETFDPERSKIEIDMLVKRKAAARELSQIEMAINASSLLSAQEKKRVMVAIGEQHNKYVDSLKSEETALKSIQAVQRGADAIQRLRTGTADIYKELEVTKYQNRLESEGVAPERIAAEVEKLRLRQWMTQEQTRLNEALEEQRKLLDELQKREKPKNEKDKADLQRQLDEALATIKSLQEQLGQLPKEGQKKADAIDAKAGEVQDPVESLIGRWKRELNDTKAMVASLGQTIQSELGSAMSNAVSGVINGTMTVQEAFGQMFANIGRAFIEMATQMIAKALILQVLNLFAGGTPSALVKGVDVPMAQMPAGMQFRASGGPISAGRPYIVGERGPELVFPGADGYVLPADRTAAALAQSRAALGGGGSSAASSSAFSENRDALSTATSMSRERQVERWLTSGASSTEIKYSRVGAGDLPFVTEQDMLQATRLAAQEGARMGQQRTMAALKNNPGARRTIGI